MYIKFSGQTMLHISGYEDIHTYIYVCTQIPRTPGGATSSTLMKVIVIVIK